MAHFYSKKSIVKKSLLNITKVSSLMSTIYFHADTIFHIINVYAPARKEHKAPFYKEFFKYIAKLKNQNLIILGDFNFVEYDEDRFLGSNIQDKTITKMCTFKTLGLIDIFKSLHNPINFTHLRSRIDRIYITALFHPKISSIQHVESFSDHKLVFLDINLDKFKPWGKYYWILNNSLLENEFYKQEILNLKTKSSKNFKKIQFFPISNTGK